MFGDICQSRTNARICSYIPNFGEYKHEREVLPMIKKMANMFEVKAKFCPLKNKYKQLRLPKKTYRSSALDCAVARYAANASANQILKK